MLEVRETLVSLTDELDNHINFFKYAGWERSIHDLKKFTSTALFFTILHKGPYLWNPLIDQ